MNLLSLALLPLTADHGWPELARRHAPLHRLLLLLVLPLTLLPPLMLYYAGNHYPEVFLRGAQQKDWAEVAIVFFCAEWITLLGMGWLIRQAAATYSLTIDYHDAFLLAGIAPVPMWLSSLGLLIPSFWVNAFIATLGLGLACGLMYQGLRALGRQREEIVAGSIVQIVIGVGLIAWALLLVFAFH
ncbi:MAG: Yip1 family protein [Gemmatimonadota bacterium]